MVEGENGQKVLALPALACRCAPEDNNSDGGSLISDVTKDTVFVRVPSQAKHKPVTLEVPQNPKINGLGSKCDLSVTPIASNARQLQTITNKFQQRPPHLSPTMETRLNRTESIAKVIEKDGSTWVDRLAYQETVSSRKMRKESTVLVKKVSLNSTLKKAQI